MIALLTSHFLPKREMRIVIAKEETRNVTCENYELTVTELKKTEGKHSKR